MTTEVQVTKTYTPVMELHLKVIGRCSAVLPNHMQCWRAGDVQVHVTTVTPGATEEDAPTVVKNSYQLCNRHAQIEKFEDEAAVKA